MDSVTVNDHTDRKMDGRRTLPFLRGLWGILNYRLGHQIAQVVIDFLAVLAGIFCAVLISRFLFGVGESPEKYWHFTLIMGMGLILAMYAMGGYKPSFLRRQEKELEIIIKTGTLSLFVLLLFNFIIFKTELYSRYISLLGYMFLVAFLMIGRFGLKRTYRYLWKWEIGRENAVIVGHGSDIGRRLQQLFDIQHFKRFRIIGFVEEENGSLLFSGTGGEQRLEMDLNAFLESYDVDTVFVDFDDPGPGGYQYYLGLLLSDKKGTRHIYSLASDLLDLRLSVSGDDYVGLMAMQASESQLNKRIPLALKRTMDMLGATLMFILISPLMLVIAVLIKMGDRGPVFHHRRVVGKNGTQFDALKFRTMIPDADNFLANRPELKAKYEENFKLKNDPRITFVGSILRKLSLDEIPQLINVLKGQMSLIGPRMVTPEELDRYGEFKKERVKVRPGISGYWQVSGRQEVDYRARIRMDQFYIYRWSVWMDLWLMLKTVQKVIKGEGAY